MLSTVFAQNAINLNPPAAANAATGITIEGAIGWAFTAILVIAAIIFFFMLIIGGIRWILSGGDKASTESARGQITAALIGLVIVFGAWAIATLLGGILGIDILNVATSGLGAIN